MKLKLAALVLGVAAAGAMLAPAAPALAKGACVTKNGKGWGFDEAQARFQAWEIVAQTTGNWPIATDKLIDKKYKCAKDGSGVTCYSWIDVCKN